MTTSANDEGCELGPPPAHNPLALASHGGGFSSGCAQLQLLRSAVGRVSMRCRHGRSQPGDSCHSSCFTLEFLQSSTCQGGSAAATACVEEHAVHHRSHLAEVLPQGRVGGESKVQDGGAPPPPAVRAAGGGERDPHSA